MYTRHPPKWKIKAFLNNNFCTPFYPFFSTLTLRVFGVPTRASFKSALYSCVQLSQSSHYFRLLFDNSKTVHPFPSTKLFSMDISSNKSIITL